MVCSASHLSISPLVGEQETGSSRGKESNQPCSKQTNSKQADKQEVTREQKKNFILKLPIIIALVAMLVMVMMTSIRCGDGGDILIIKQGPPPTGQLHNAH